MTALARLAAVLLALLLWPGAVAAQTFPKFTGLVVDDAGVLPADRKAALEAKLEAFQQRTRRQLVVATIRDLQGYTREDYGYRLLRAWGPGLRDLNNGAILFIAPNAPVGQRSARVEVGYGLEPVLTDAFSSVVINQVMLPKLKAGDIPGALDAGADAIIQQLSLPDDQAKARLDAAVKAFDRNHRRTSGGGAGVPLGLIFWAMVIAFVFLAHRRRAAGPWGGQRYGGGGSNWPIWLWAASELMDGDRRRGGGWGDGGGGGFGGWGGGGSDGGPDGSWGGGGFTGGGGGSGGGGGASGSW